MFKLLSAVALIAVAASIADAAFCPRVGRCVQRNECAALAPCLTQGEQGEQGPAGPVGPAGPAGPQGEAGLSCKSQIFTERARSDRVLAEQSLVVECPAGFEAIGGGCDHGTPGVVMRSGQLR
eukprot:CAMPEP_0198307456 /NCGR_PEP_ID=MMETSP1450-20131203/333_1 /TAXON_ID=753684 ORGANISM="Madagascaria erythrocladiodes, Strain CCMP3234" /NCGR_SAMPLE_ID=MMETSP1450 /ASSEMBLY_ACC=CAM_ASM_001115 /LENGTH=122 /DNA_ID=CAMNT_0044010037 /DNA_START=119 /DNA_END=483 /DNA_ORIENTATION=-